eukprot:12297068-Ditylum_brightwellii.AAC.1
MGKENAKKAFAQIEAGGNVVLFANHQSEADPQVFSILLKAISSGEEATLPGMGVQNNELFDNEKYTTQPSQTMPEAKETTNEGTWFWNDVEWKWLAKKAHEITQPSKTEYTLPMGC